jgi:hypothetical protein
VSVFVSVSTFLGVSTMAKNTTPTEEPRKTKTRVPFIVSFQIDSDSPLIELEEQFATQVDAKTAAALVRRVLSELEDATATSIKFSIRRAVTENNMF